MLIRQAICASALAALMAATSGCGAANNAVTQAPTRMAAAAMPSEATPSDQGDVPQAAIQEADRTQGPTATTDIWMRPYYRPYVHPYPVWGTYSYYPTYGYYGYYPGYGYGYGYRYGGYGHYGYRWGGRWGHYGYGRRGGYGGYGGRYGGYGGRGRRR